jgi:hypothetical protein
MKKMLIYVFYLKSFNLQAGKKLKEKNYPTLPPSQSWWFLDIAEFFKRLISSKKLQNEPTFFPKNKLSHGPKIDGII